MKTSKFFALMLIGGSFFLQESCSEGIANTDDVLSELKSGVIPDSCVISGTVTEGEANGILWMADEEKMARDVYVYFNEKYKLPVFRNISRSEAIHMKAVGNLISAFKLTYEGNDTPGEYVNDAITKMYTELTEKGSVSLVEALKAGALIEETDILDLEKEILSTDNVTVKRVFTNLLLASENHLRAFTAVLKFQKVVYEPVLLDGAYYQAVIDKKTKGADFDGKRAKSQ